GDSVKVTMPDLNTQVAGHITYIASTAVVTSGQGPQRPTIAVNVTVEDTRKLAGYDAAPVQVALTIEVHRNVLAIPVQALLARPDGTYAVRVVEGTRRSLVTVVPGLQGQNSLVEVSGGRLHAGDLVEVPQS